MSTSHHIQSHRRGLSKRLWRSVKIFTAAAPLSIQDSIRSSLHRLGGQPQEDPPQTMQPGADTTAIEMPGPTLFADTIKINPTEWFPAYQSCLRHFLDVSQHSPKTQSLAALINILLPCQRSSDPVFQYSEQTTTGGGSSGSDYELRAGAVSLIPYIRRLVVTATDTSAIMRELFGEQWFSGIGPLHSQERVNYLFAAKSGGWLETKTHYDLSPYETVPFLRPLRDPQEEELRAADARWSQWLAMEDWMVGPRSPFGE